MCIEASRLTNNYKTAHKLWRKNKPILETISRGEIVVEPEKSYSKE
jgi:hypothetical protein